VIFFVIYFFLSGKGATSHLCPRYPPLQRVSRLDVSVSAVRRSIELREVEQLDVVEGVLADAGVFQRVATPNPLAAFQTKKNNRHCHPNGHFYARNALSTRRQRKLQAKRFRPNKIFIPMAIKIATNQFTTKLRRKIKRSTIYCATI